MKLKNFANKYNYICYWCNKKFPLDELSRDHINPVGRAKQKGGGKGSPKNCVLACIFCNQKRGNKPFEHFKYEIDKENVKNIPSYYELNDIMKPSRLKN